MSTIEPNKQETFGRKGEPTSPRPPAPPAQSTSEEQAPNLEMMESAKNAMLTFCMYYYQALRQDGYDVVSSKQFVADEIMQLYDRYATAGRMEFRPDRIRDPYALLDEIIKDTKALGMQGKGIERKLIDFKRLIKE